MRALPSLLLLLAACSKTAEPGKLLDFVPPTPGSQAPACVAANDGKRFVVDGYVGKDGDVTVDDGKVSLDVAEGFADGEQTGKSFPVELKDGTHVKFDVANEKAAVGPAVLTTTKGDLQGIRLLTTAGEASPADKLGVVFDVEVVKHFQTGEITACVWHVVELHKR
ncbi:MAG: hypothetical protein JNL82_24985 [Myxococcales bacterium]|nr:hypothetical protein [Myxococcales bacterium]